MFDPLEGEECEDGNQDNDDGCDSICLLEPGWEVTIEILPDGSENIQIGPIIGDGILRGFEICDDNDQLNDTCCNSLGTGFRRGFYPVLPIDTESPTQCTTNGTDGIRVGDEDCDDGNDLPDDGCYLGQVESRWSCAEDDLDFSHCSPSCGNGVLEPEEDCDD